MSAAKPKPGRPVSVGIESVFVVRGPEDLMAAMRRKADRLAVSVSEAWRRAAREFITRADHD